MLKKLVKRNNEYTIENISNGYILTINGRDNDQDWVTEKLHVGNFDQLMGAIRALDEMPIDD
jgi:hypothetical protein